MANKAGKSTVHKKTLSYQQHIGPFSWLLRPIFHVSESMTYYETSSALLKP